MLTLRDFNNKPGMFEVNSPTGPFLYATPRL
jgi:hypothetical protein